MTKLWQAISDWFSSWFKSKKVKVDDTIKPQPKPQDSTTGQNTSTSATGTACKCRMTGALIDPDPARYTEDYMCERKNPAQVRYEEVGLEECLKIISRCCVIRGISGGFWMLSSLVDKRIGRDQNNNGIVNCFTENGIQYHIKGYCDDEPQGNAIRTIPLNKNGKYIVIECRKA